MKVKLLEIVKSQLLKIELSISVDESFTTAHQSANVAMVEALVQHVKQLDQAGQTRDQMEAATNDWSRTERKENVPSIQQSNIKAQKKTKMTSLCHH